MKEVVIQVVNIVVWLALAGCVLAGFAIGEIWGAVAGFVAGCMISGLWFLLVSIDEKLGIIAGIEKTPELKPVVKPTLDPKLWNEPD